MTRSGSRTIPFVAALTLLATATSCGTTRGLVDASYPGQPVVIIAGELRAPASGDAPTRLAVAWLARAEQRASFLGAIARGHGLCAIAGLLFSHQTLEFEPQFPSRFVLTLSAAPPEHTQHALADGVRAAIGLLLSFEDRDGDGVFDPSEGEHIQASSLDGDQALLFLDGSSTGDSSLQLPKAPEGMSILERVGGELIATPANTPIRLERAGPRCP